MTTIDDLLSALDVGVEPFAVCDVRAGWRLTLPADGWVTVHYGLAGRGRLVAAGGAGVDFAPESLIVCPPGVAQTLEGAAGSEPTRCVQPAEGLAWLRAGEAGPRVLLACGRVRASAGGGLGLFDGLAAPIAESFADDPETAQAFRTMLGELGEPCLGGRAAAESLMKLCLVRLLRRLVARGDARLPWLAAVGDPRLGAAVGAILRHPGRRHSLEDLAAAAGMSRSAFAQRFRAALGEGPHAFLAGSRLAHAADLLRTTRLPVKTVAGRVGYRSRSHFSRAFKARYGVDPAGFRTGAADPATAAVPRGPGQPPPAADQGGPASPVAFWGPQERRSG